MKSKYLEITEVVPMTKKKTREFHVFNSVSGSRIGFIQWYPPFRKYAFFPNVGCVFDPNCLTDIADFIIEKNEGHKNS